MTLRAIEDHHKVLDAIIAHDAASARQLVCDHLSYFEERAWKLDTR
jgi:DNA-binding FadR family transcriptional regulator